MRPYERVRAEVDCPRCGAKPGRRCITQDQWRFPRSNHPQRNRAYAEAMAEDARKDQRA